MNPSESPAPEAAAKPKHISRMGCWLIVLLGLVLLFIAVPGYLRHRGFGVSHNSCVANLKQINGAVLQWAFENQKAATDTYSLTDPKLLRQMRGGVLPLCPGGGRYSPGTNVSDQPRCSLAASGHTL